MPTELSSFPCPRGLHNRNDLDVLKLLRARPDFKVQESYLDGFLISAAVMFASAGPNFAKLSLVTLVHESLSYEYTKR